jgi:hypothetical protein
MRALDAAINMRPSFPPIGWFEHVVNNAICNYLRRELGSGGRVREGENRNKDHASQ